MKKHLLKLIKNIKDFANNITSVSFSLFPIVIQPIAPEALTDLFKIINSEPELLKEYVTYESWLQDYEHLKSVWIKSPFFASGQTVQGKMN